MKHAKREQQSVAPVSFGKIENCDFITENKAALRYTASSKRKELPEGLSRRDF